MTVLNWLNLRWSAVRTTIASGDVRTFEQRYLPAAVVCGMVLGACVALVSALLAVILILGGGFAIGYATRAYVSFRRRTASLRRRGELL